MISERLREVREQTGMTQKETANILGIKRSTYSGWENNIDPIPLKMLFKFSDYFNISMDYICNLSNVKNKKFIKNNLDYVEIGKKIKFIRTKMKDTQEIISKKIGMDQSNYSKIEKGRYLIKLYPLIEFAKNYNVSIDFICGRNNNPYLQ